MLRLNMAIPPSSEPQHLRTVGRRPAGFPNGRRVKDDVVAIESARRRRRDVSRWSIRATRRMARRRPW